MSDLISRQDIKYHTQLEAMGNGQYEEVEVAYKNDIESLPSTNRPTVDCTKFMEWLKAEVLDEENWELNAIANGEVICRKFKKLGWLDVEDGFYVDARPTGKWIEEIAGNGWNEWVNLTCDQCGAKFEKAEVWLYCPNCGARINGESK